MKREFEIGALLCQFGCRAGLTTKNDAKCDHLDENKLRSLGEELSMYEQRQTSPSELFQVHVSFCT